MSKGFPGAEFLETYGFVQTKDGWIKSGPDGRERTKYEATEGGFLRFEREDGVWRQYPYTIHPDWEGVGGLAFDVKQAAMSGIGGKVKPECFEWVYPPSEIERTYGAEREAPRVK